MAKIIHSPLILPSEVMHARTMPRINKFKYSSTYFAIPLKKTEPIKSRFLSFNRSNFFSISDQDYAHKANIEKVLFDHQINKYSDLRQEETFIIFIWYLSIIFSSMFIIIFCFILLKSTIKY